MLTVYNWLLEQPSFRLGDVMFQN